MHEGQKTVCIHPIYVAPGFRVRPGKRNNYVGALKVAWKVIGP